MNYEEMKEEFRKNNKFLRASNNILSKEVREYENLVLELYGYIPWGVKGIKKLRKAIHKIKVEGRK